MHWKRARGPARAGGPTARAHIVKLKLEQNMEFPNKKKGKIRNSQIKKKGKKGVKKH